MRISQIFGFSEGAEDLVTLDSYSYTESRKCGDGSFRHKQIMSVT